MKRLTEEDLDQIIFGSRLIEALTWRKELVTDSSIVASAPPGKLYIRYKDLAKLLDEINHRGISRQIVLVDDWPEEVKDRRRKDLEANGS